MSERVQVGQVWRDNDPRGGPTFRVRAVDAEYAYVEDLNGARPRRVLLRRLRPRWYSLISEGNFGRD